MSKDELPRENFPGGDVVPEEGELRVSIDKKAHSEIMNHVSEEDPDIEICGVFVGKRKRDKHGEFLHILHAIRGEKAERKGMQVTFTHGTWNHINRENDTKYPDLDIVGWYHTHPNFDIFLSEMDRFIQKQFFSAPHQVAFVYDPHKGLDGFFRNKGDDIVPLERYWRGGTARKSSPREQRLQVPEAASEGAGKSTPSDLPSMMTALNDSVKRLHLEVREQQGGGAFWYAAFLALGLLIGFFASSLLKSSQPSYIEVIDPVTGNRSLRLQERIILIEQIDPTTGRRFFVQKFLDDKLLDSQRRQGKETDEKK